MTWSSRGYEIKDNTRMNCICSKCRLHTIQVKTKKGWVCKECRKIQKEE